ncbi:hypothetical protein HN51_061171 [Arachis hypogaea]|uniref:Uncharacterized protein n=1 Tax=Arachis hypogaea TaxID=3818 RepID=A0A445AMI2_ARAHY|nr:uncharacterized protein DS421_11g319870 [Arachis hypogaea]RYR27550.1 hypothetical protein Ahy_B01g051567 [Arachis hypogaea]
MTFKNALLILGILAVITLIPSEVLARDLPASSNTLQGANTMEEINQINGPNGLGRHVIDLDGGKYNIDIRCTRICGGLGFIYCC